MGETSTFMEHSQNVAGNFLHTVVVVDDQAGFRDERPHGGLRKPGRNRIPSEVGELPGRDVDGHELDARLLIDAFADLGLVCGVIQPNPAGGYLEKIDRATQRADIVVLDWKIGDDYGDFSIEVIRKIISTDSTLGERLRLIVVYTFEPLVDVAEKLEAELEPTKINRDRWHFDLGPARIIVLGKKGISGFKGWSFSELELPERLIQEFAEITSGLLSNAALASASAIRRNVHTLISKFRPELDSPYLAHRAMLDPPAEAEDHIIPLIVSEIHDILLSQDIDEQVNLSRVRGWVDSLDLSILKRRLRTKGKREAADNVVNVLEHGLTKYKERSTGVYWRKYLGKLDRTSRETGEGTKETLSGLTRMLCNDQSDPVRLDCELAALVALRSQYQEAPPELRLGTVVRAGQKYFFCIQPLCDCLRIKKQRKFQFLRLKERDNEQFPLDLVIQEGTAIRELRVSFRPYETEEIEFKPDPNKRKIVPIVFEESKWGFIAADKEETRYTWIAELKLTQALKIANQYAAQLSRVGVTESEWVRRQARR